MKTETEAEDWPGASIIHSVFPDVLPIRVLECSGQGDKRFSAFHARVTMFGKNDIIENHYQLAKQLGDIAPTHWRQVKGRIPSHLEINGKQLDARFLTPWYKLLWLIYLDDHPELVEYAKNFDDFTDVYKANSINCQADVVRQYIIEGRDSIEAECSELIELLLV